MDIFSLNLPVVHFLICSEEEDVELLSSRVH